MATGGTSLASGERPRAAVGGVCVVSVPARHPYVGRMAADPGIRVQPDPIVPGAPDGVWWPPVVLDPDWIEANRDAAQVLHIHFGTESFSAARLRACLEAAHRVGWVVVFTAHDLEHPQLGDQSGYRRQLNELMRGADAVITLTESAAAVIERRWGVSAVVIPHPSVRDRDAPMPRVHVSEDIRIGVHLKDLRPNVDGPGTVAALLEAASGLRAAGTPAVAEIRLHHRVRDAAARDRVRRLCAADERAVLVEHDRLSDAELDVALSRLDACVLPYRHGTHSGWLELCWDLGVPVAAPVVGHYMSQHEEGPVAGFAPGDADSLRDALAAVLSSDAASRPASRRREQLVSTRRAARAVSDVAGAAAHAALYRRLLAERRP